MLHCSDCLALFLHVLTCRLVLNQLLSCNRMLAFRQARELLFLYLTVEPPVLREFAMPLATYPVTFGVVVLSSVGKFLLVIRLSLRCTQRSGNRKHDLFKERFVLCGNPSRLFECVLLYQRKARLRCPRSNID